MSRAACHFERAAPTRLLQFPEVYNNGISLSEVTALEASGGSFQAIHMPDRALRVTL